MDLSHLLTAEFVAALLVGVLTIGASAVGATLRIAWTMRSDVREVKRDVKESRKHQALIRGELSELKIVAAKQGEKVNSIESEVNDLCGDTHTVHDRLHARITEMSKDATRSDSRLGEHDRRLKNTETTIEDHTSRIVRLEGYNGIPTKPSGGTTT